MCPLKLSKVGHFCQLAAVCWLICARGPIMDRASLQPKLYQRSDLLICYSSMETTTSSGLILAEDTGTAIVFSHAHFGVSGNVFWIFTTATAWQRIVRHFPTNPLVTTTSPVTLKRSILSLWACPVAFFIGEYYSYSYPLFFLFSLQFFYFTYNLWSSKC